VTAASDDYDDLHHLVDRLTPRQAAHDDEQPHPPSIIGIWDSGRGDLSERHDEIIRERIKRTA